MSAMLAIVDGPKHKSPLALILKETQSSAYSEIGNVYSVQMMFEKEQPTRYRAIADTHMVGSPMQSRTSFRVAKLDHCTRRYLT
jgi:hypothetical protein